MENGHYVVPPQLSAAQILLPLLGVLLLLKISLATRAFVVVKRTGLISAKTLQSGSLIWLAAAIVCVAAFLYALAPIGASPWLVTSIVVLMLPANRILWQVIGLDRSRHRQT
jgi:hypothetical protein